MSRTLPGLGLTGFWGLGYDGWNTANDENLRTLSALVQATVLDRVASVPGSPSDGDIYLITAGGDANKIAIHDDGAWVYLTPREGWQVWVADEDVFYVFDGSAWGIGAGGGTGDVTKAANNAFTGNNSHTGLEMFGLSTSAISLAGASAFKENTNDDSSVWSDAYLMFGAHAYGTQFGYGKTRNASAASHTAVQNLDWVKEEWFYGSDGSDYQCSAHFVVEVHGTVSSGTVPMAYGWDTSPDHEGNLTRRFTFGPHGELWIGPSFDPGTSGYVLISGGPNTPPSWGEPKPVEAIGIACSDESTAISTTGVKATFRMPYRFILTAVRGSLTTAQSSGSLLTFDVKESGTTIFSTTPTFDNTEKTTTTAATAPVLSDTDLANDAEITVNVSQVGSGDAAGLKIWLIGHRY